MIHGMFSFNGMEEHQRFAERLLARFQPNYCIETGTLHGWTTAFFAERVQNVHTIEIVPINMEWSQRHLKGYKNITFHLGNSKDELPKILEQIPTREKVLFYLDAHWESYWPLYDELDIIANYIGRRAIVIIDDFKVPGKDYAYDSYNCMENCLEYADPHLRKIYGGDYDYEYFGGDTYYDVVFNEVMLNPMEKEIYDMFFKGQKRQTTGKIVTYEHQV